MGPGAVSYTHLEVTDITEQPKEEPKKEEQPQEVKEIHITNEQGLKDIAKAPDKTYILDSDIAVTSDSIPVSYTHLGRGKVHDLYQYAAGICGWPK